jgi:hypothetical protein
MVTGPIIRFSRGLIIANQSAFLKLQGEVRTEFLKAVEIGVHGDGGVIIPDS